MTREHPCLGPAPFSSTYDLATEGVTLISFQGARVEVHSAGNNGIEYTVLSGF